MDSQHQDIQFQQAQTLQQYFWKIYSSSATYYQHMGCQTPLLGWNSAEIHHYISLEYIRCYLEQSYLNFSNLDVHMEGTLYEVLYKCTKIEKMMKRKPLIPCCQNDGEEEMGGRKSGGWKRLVKRLALMRCGESKHQKPTLRAICRGFSLRYRWWG